MNVSRPTQRKNKKSVHTFGRVASSTSTVLAAFSMFNITPGCASSQGGVTATPASPSIVSKQRIVPYEKLLSTGYPDHLMTEKHMLIPHFEAIASGISSFIFRSDGNAILALRSRQLLQGADEISGRFSHNQNELIIYDTRNLKEYTLFNETITHPHSTLERSPVRYFGFYNGGVVFQILRSVDKKDSPEEPQTSKVFDVFWKSSPYSSSEPKKLITVGEEEGEFCASPNQTIPPLIYFFPTENGEKAKIQILDGSKAIPFPEAVENEIFSLLTWTADGKELTFSKLKGPKYCFRVESRTFEKKADEKVQDSSASPKKSESDELGLITAPVNGSNLFALYLKSNSKLEPGESDKIMLFAGRKPPKDWYFSRMSPNKNSLAFITPSPDRTLYFVYWSSQDKWRSVYDPYLAMDDSLAVVVAIEEYNIQELNREIGFGKPPFEIPKNPKETLSQYLLPENTGALDRFVFVDKGVIPGFHTNKPAVGYLPVFNGDKVVVFSDMKVKYMKTPDVPNISTKAEGDIERSAKSGLDSGY